MYVFVCSSYVYLVNLVYSDGLVYWCVCASVYWCVDV